MLHALITPSSPQLYTIPSFVVLFPKTTSLTHREWASKFITNLRVCKSHIRNVPSTHPVTIGHRLDRCMAMQEMASTCPPCNSPRNGWANIRSSLAEVTARVYSRARAWGWEDGSRFLCVIRRSWMVERVVLACERERALTFMVC